MLCCHGNNWRTQRIILVAFFITGVQFFVCGEAINNGSYHEILLAPELDPAVTLQQPKSLDPQDMHDHPTQLHVVNSGTTATKNPVSAALPIPEVEASLYDGEKQNTQQGLHTQEQTTHPEIVVEITHNESGTEKPSTEEPETSGFFETEENFGTETPYHTDDITQDIEYASGNGHIETTWESARTEAATEKSANLSHLDFDETDQNNSRSEIMHGIPKELRQTEVAYDFNSATDYVSTSTVTNQRDNNANTSYIETRIESDVTASEYPTPSTTSPWEQGIYLSTSTTGHDAHSNISNAILLPPETEQAITVRSTQILTASWHLASVQTSNASNDVQYRISQLENELKLLQNAVTPSSEILSASAENALPSTETISPNPILSSITNTTHLPNTTPLSMITSHIMDSRGSVTLLRSDVLHNNLQVTETTHIFSSSFLTADFQSTEKVPNITMNITDWTSASMLANHHSILSNDSDSVITNDTFGVRHFAHVEMFEKNTDSPDNAVFSGRISPTKTSADKDVRDAQVNGVKHDALDTDAQPKQETDLKKEDDGNKTQHTASTQSDIQKGPTGDGQETSAPATMIANNDTQSQWANNVPELASSIRVFSATGPRSFSTVMVLESSSSELYNTTAVDANGKANRYNGNSSMLFSTIQPSPTVNQQQSKTAIANQPTTAPVAEPDHILPTVKIPTTYLSMTMRCSWSNFCLHQDDLRLFFAYYLSNTTKHAIQPSQIVFFNTNVCKHIYYSENEVNDGFANSIVVQMYVASRHGDASTNLTERLAHVLVKNKLQGFNDKMKLQDVVLAVQLHGKEEKPHLAITHLPNDGGSDMGIIAAITISGIASICLVLLCILLVVLKRRHILKQQRRRCRPVRPDAYSLDSISIYSSFYKRKVRASKRSYLNQGFEDPNAPTNKLNFAGLANLCTDENALAEEYKQIPMTMAKFGDIPPGADIKNRYANVIPFPETRVQLPAKEGDPASGYINANYVRGFRGDQRTYIACQAPMESTTADFWEMVWENQSKVIIMLTDWEEEGVKNLMRDVFHYWYTAWPAVGVPSDRVSIVEMLTEARAAMRAASVPTIVHCSPGTGRTGTVLAIHTSKQEYETSRTVDIPQCVYRLRRDRGGCVQTSEQYRFIYEVIHEFAAQLRNPSGRSSLRSSK